MPKDTRMLLYIVISIFYINSFSLLYYGIFVPDIVSNEFMLLLMQARQAADDVLTNQSIT